MYVIKNMKNKTKKEWHTATKSLKAKADDNEKSKVHFYYCTSSTLDVVSWKILKCTTVNFYEDILQSKRL
jgi:hypothetical protein